MLSTNSLATLQLACAAQGEDLVVLEQAYAQGVVHYLGRTRLVMREL